MVRNKDGVDISACLPAIAGIGTGPCQMRSASVAGGRTADLHIPNRNGDNGEKTRWWPGLAASKRSQGLDERMNAKAAAALDRKVKNKVAMQQKYRDKK